MNSLDSEFTIIGAGVAGLTAAIGLQKIKRDFIVFEQSKVLKGLGAGFGLAANAMQAFQLLELKDEVEKIGFYTNSFNILDTKGNILLAPNTKILAKNYKQSNFTVHRADLHLFLLSKIEDNKLSLGKRATRFINKGDCIEVFFDDESSHTTKYLIIADGVKSPLRQQLLPQSTIRYSGYTCWRATIDNRNIQLTKGSETWGSKGRFGMTPLVHDRLYWYACINSTANNPLYKNYSSNDLANHFSTYHQPIPEILSQPKDEELIWNDIIDIKPLKNLAYDNILLIGDAGHATTPNMGQGACQAIEDVAVLLDELQSKNNVRQAFQSFEKRRLARTAYITNTSKQIGQIAQWENPIMIGFRNTLMKCMPTRLAQRNLEKLLSVNFMEINK